MIQVDVRHQDIAHVVGSHPAFFEAGQQGRKRRPGPRLDQHRTLRAVNQKRSDDVRSALELEIYDVDLHEGIIRPRVDGSVLRWLHHGALLGHPLVVLHVARRVCCAAPHFEPSFRHRVRDKGTVPW